MSRYDQFEQPNRVKPIRLIIIILLILIVVGIGYLIYPVEDGEGAATTQNNATQRQIPLEIPNKNKNKNKAEDQQTKINSPPTSADTAVNAALTVSQIHPELPPLAQSDAIIQQDILKLAPQLSAWFTNNKHLIKKFLTIVNDLSQGLRPYKHFHFLNPKQSFKVQQDRQGLAIDPMGYRRYDVLVTAVEQLDVNTCMQYYRAYQPLLQQIFDTFGYPENHKLDDIFRKAIAQILQAPILEQRIALVKHANRYKFADKKLESLNPVHKQMLRMGPNNTVKFQNKLRQFAQALVD